MLGNFFQYKKKVKFILLNLAFLFHIQGYSQDFISGIIKDAETQNILVGADIRQIEGKIIAISNENGEFKLKLSDKSPVVVNYIGYKSDTLRNFSNLSVEIFLTPSSKGLDAFTVNSRFSLQQIGLRNQKESKNIKNMISADQIKLFPDMNAAEAVARVPGITLQRDQGEGRFVQLRGTAPWLSTLNINGEQVPSPEGDVRYVGLDVIAADQIEFVEITKALTPDMDGDAIAGNVNIITKKARNTEPTLNMAFSGGYNNISKQPNLMASVSFGQRIKKLGFHLNANHQINNQGAHNIEYKFVQRPTQEDTSFNPVYSDIQFRHYSITRTRTGITTTMDYSFSKNSFIILRGMFNNFSDNEIRSRVRHKLGSGTIINKYYAKEAKIERDLKMRTKQQQIASLNLNGSSNINKAKLEYGLAISNAFEHTPDRFEMVFESDELDIQLDLSEPNFPRISYPLERDENNAFDIENYAFEEMELRNDFVEDLNKTARLDLSIPLKNPKNYLKVGGKWRNKTRERNNIGVTFNKYYNIFLPGTRQIYLQEGPDLNLAILDEDLKVNNLLNRGYELGPTPDPQLSKDFYEYYQQHFKIDEDQSKQKSFNSDYQAKENIYAAYAMGEYNLGKLSIVGGLRYELTEIEHKGNVLKLEKGRFFRDLFEEQKNYSRSFLLPQIHLTYRPDRNTNIRFAATTSYSRPNFEDNLPYREEENEDEVTYGNPLLNYPKSFNLDFMLEKYLPNNGLLSGGLFYKRIDDFIFFYKRFVHEDSNFSTAGLNEITMANNGLFANVMGIELTANIKFSKLPKNWRHFGILSNYTFTLSEAFINQRLPIERLDQVFIYGTDGKGFLLNNNQREKITLPGQSPHTANFSLFYDHPKFYAKLSANYQDRFLNELGAENELDVFYDRQFHLDFLADYVLNPQIKCFIQINNITNQPLRYYLGNPSLTKQYEFYSWWGRIGLKANF